MLGGVEPTLMSCGLQEFGFGGGSKIRYLGFQLGLGKPGIGVKEASNQPTVAEPKEGFLTGAAFSSCSSRFPILGLGKPGKQVQEAYLFQLLVAVSLLILGLGKPGKTGPGGPEPTSRRKTPFRKNSVF